MANRLREFRDQKGLTRKELAKRAASGESTITKIEDGDRNLTINMARRFAPHLDCAVWDLEPEELVRLLPEIQHSLPPVSSSLTYEGQEYVPVMRYDTYIAAGEGADPGATPEPIGHLLFRKEWLERVTKAPVEMIAIFTVDGDSMAPVLAHEDVVLFDRTDTALPEDTGIYVISRGGDLQVKRIYAGNPPLVASENPDPRWRPRDYDETTDEIQGRVIWLGRKVE